MRTKTLLLTAALSAAGLVTSMAQVYSVNIVGYINLTIPAGYSMLANQLNASPDNTVANLIPTPPDGTTVYKYFTDGTGFHSADFTDGAWEGETTLTINPGQGVFILAPSSFTQTFVGEVQLVSDTALPIGYSIASSAVPQSAAIDTVLGYVPSNGDFIYEYLQNDGSGHPGYISNDFTDGAWEGAGNGASPVPAVGEAFWVLNAGAGANHWTRTFSVGP